MHLNEEQFRSYLKDTRGVSDVTVRRYITGLQTINSILQKYYFDIPNVYDVRSFEDLETIKNFLDVSEEYRTKDRIGHSMYSASFKHFYRFAYSIIASQK